MKESFIERLNSELSAFQIENRKPAKYIFLGRSESIDLFFKKGVAESGEIKCLGGLFFYKGAEIIDVAKGSFFLLA